VFNDLNLGFTEKGAIGRHGMTKAGITQDLIENLEKDMDKLKREKEIIEKRKSLSLYGPQKDLTSQEKLEETRMQMNYEL